MFNISWLEWLGYLASVIVLISLLMSSIVKLRWVNLVGAIIFATYGFLLGALPVGIMNTTIAFINIYYLTKLYRSKDVFKIISVDQDKTYLNHFICYFEKDIKKYNSAFEKTDFEGNMSFFVLRNTVPAGLFIAKKHDDKTLDIKLDYAIPLYRDLKIGNYIFNEKASFFTMQGYKYVISQSVEKEHYNYLVKMGFQAAPEFGENYFIKELD